MTQPEIKLSRPSRAVYFRTSFAELSRALEKNDVEAAREFQSRIKDSAYSGMHSYRSEILKENISEVLCRIKSHVTPSDPKHLDFVDYFLTFTGDRENIIRCVKLKVEILSIEINIGVEKASNKFFDLRKKLGDDWKVSPTLPDSTPNWFCIYGFLFREVTLPSLHPVAQVFNDEFFKISSTPEQIKHLEEFVSKLAKNGSLAIMRSFIVQNQGIWYYSYNLNFFLQLIPCFDDSDSFTILQRYIKNGIRIK